MTQKLNKSSALYNFWSYDPTFLPPPAAAPWPRPRPRPRPLPRPRPRPLFTVELSAVSGRVLVATTRGTAGCLNSLDEFMTMSAVLAVIAVPS